MFRKIIVNIMIFTCQEAAFLKNFVLFLNEYDCFDFESAVMHSWNILIVSLLMKAFCSSRYKICVTKYQPKLMQYIANLNWVN